MKKDTFKLGSSLMMQNNTSFSRMDKQIMATHSGMLCNIICIMSGLMTFFPVMQRGNDQ